MQQQDGPVIVCGLGAMGWPVLGYLRALGGELVAIDQEATPSDPRLDGVKLVRGNFRDQAMLQEAGVRKARGILLLANDDLNNLAACLEIRQLNPTARIVVRLFNENLVAKLGTTVGNVVALSAARLAGPLFASTALSGEVLSRFCVNKENWQIEQVTMDADSDYIGKPATELVKQFPRTQLIATESFSSSPLSPGGRGVGGEGVLEAGSTILVAGPEEQLEDLRAAALGEEGLTAKWAGRVVRFLRTIVTTVQEVEWPVKLAATCFFAVILFGSIVCWITGLADTVPRGLFRTINIMVTSADLREQDYPAAWQHAFVSFLKLAGLLLTAAFTALLTNYLVRARLRGVLSISRIPESGHVVLCGLGTVGMRVVESLRQQDIPVVVLEKMEGSRFLATARQAGATVLLGDGTLPATLNRAHASNARALIAATSSDLANVEIAILAKEQNPKLRVVIRLDDAALASALRETANIRFALGLPQMIAPAFVLPLFGDRILSLFWMDSVLHLVMEIVVTPEARGLIGQTTEQLQQKLHCSIVVTNGLKGELTVGQSIILITPAERLKEVVSLSYGEGKIS